MKKILFATLLLIGSMVSMALAQSKAIQNVSGQLVVANGSGLRSLLQGGDYNTPLDWYRRPIDIAEDDKPGTFRVSVSFEPGASLYQASSVDLSHDWSDYAVGLGMNYLDTPGEPAVPSQSMGKMPIGKHVDGENRIEFRRVKLPTNGKVVALTLPTKFDNKGDWTDANSHPWGWIAWYTDAFVQRGQTVAYAIKYDATARSFRVAGRAKEPVPPGAEQSAAR